MRTLIRVLVAVTVAAAGLAVLLHTAFDVSVRASVLTATVFGVSALVVALVLAAAALCGLNLLVRLSKEAGPESTPDDQTAGNLPHRDVAMGSPAPVGDSEVWE